MLLAHITFLMLDTLGYHIILGHSISAALHALIDIRASNLTIATLAGQTKIMPTIPVQTIKTTLVYVKAAAHIAHWITMPTPITSPLSNTTSTTIVSSSHHPICSLDTLSPYLPPSL